LGNERLQQILDAVCYDPSLRLPFLGCWIAALESRREHLLRPHSRLMKGHTAIRPDGVLAQLRPGACSAVEYEEHLAAFRRDLDAEARAPGIPVDYV